MALRTHTIPAHIDIFSALPDMTRKQQGDIRTVLRALHKAGRFSAFEASDNMTIANTLKTICQGDHVECDLTTGYPWTRVTLTPLGMRTAGLDTEGKE